MSTVRMRALIAGIATPCLLLLLVSAMIILFAPGTTQGGDKWTGVDEAVVEKIGADHGRAARKPLINTDQGDMLLFVFLLAGAAGGFAGGYYWRKLVEQRAGNAKGNSHA